MKVLVLKLPLLSLHGLGRVFAVELVCLQVPQQRIGDSVSLTVSSSMEMMSKTPSLPSPVSCRCPAGGGPCWPCGAPPPAHRCAACTRCYVPPRGALVGAGLPDPPASSCTSPPAPPAGSPGQMSAWGGVCVGGVEHQDNNMFNVQHVIRTELKRVPDCDELSMQLSVGA